MTEHCSVTLASDAVLTFDASDVRIDNGSLVLLDADGQALGMFAPGEWRGLLGGAGPLDSHYPSKPRGHCSACRFFDGALGQDAHDGVCRRNAPQPEPRLTQAVEIDPTAWWPVVGVGEWCGEFEEME